MHKFFDDLMTKLAYAAKDYNLIFSTVTTLVAAAYFTALANDKLIIGLLLFLLFNFLILFSAFGRIEEQINKSDTVETVNVKISVFSMKQILILVIANIISYLHIITEVIIIKAAIIFIASLLLTEGWTNIFKKQILSQLEDELNEVQ